MKDWTKHWRGCASIRWESSAAPSPKTVPRPAAKERLQKRVLRTIRAVTF